MKTAERKWRQKRALFRLQMGQCYYCQGRMLLTKWNMDNGKPPLNLATIEHLDCRFNSERGKRGGEYRRVLACWYCNSVKNQLDQAVLTPEEAAYFRSPRAQRGDGPSIPPERFHALRPERLGPRPSVLPDGKTKIRNLEALLPGCPA